MLGDDAHIFQGEARHFLNNQRTRELLRGRTPAGVAVTEEKREARTGFSKVSQQVRGSTMRWEGGRG